MAILEEIRRYIRVGVVRIETTDCPWCTDESVCGAHHAEAEKLRRKDKKRT